MTTKGSGWVGSIKAPEWYALEKSFGFLVAGCTSSKVEESLATLLVPARNDTSLHVWMSIIGEEFAEANAALLEGGAGLQLRDELIQVAACAIASINALYYQ